MCPSFGQTTIYSNQDVHMPVMNGVTCTRLIREFEAHSHRRPVPIIALTADTTTRQKNACLEAGCNDYLAKPVNYPDLLLTLERFHSVAKLDGSSC
jgi:CheY-like chemotaxis protein